MIILCRRKSFFCLHSHLSTITEPLEMRESLINYIFPDDNEILACSFYSLRTLCILQMEYRNNRTSGKMLSSCDIWLCINCNKLLSSLYLTPLPYETSRSIWKLNGVFNSKFFVLCLYGKEHFQQIVP